MITEITIENYKSIEKLKVDLGRINVFIGENGAGKSNILEIIALAGAAAADKLDNEFLTSRGIRVTKPEHMRSAFPDRLLDGPIQVSVKTDLETTASFALSNDNALYSKWHANIDSEHMELQFPAFQDWVEKIVEEMKNTTSTTTKKEASELLGALLAGLKTTPIGISGEKASRSRTNFSLPANDVSIKFAKILAHTSVTRSKISSELGNFVIYSPENSLLRTFEKEGQIEPLGINGEGLLKLLSFYDQEANHSTLTQVKKSLKVLDWFTDFSPLISSSDAKLLIKDRFLAHEIKDFDHKSTNEGFFFLLFYFLLFNSDITPSFFAVDNIDASLNPKLCEKLIKELVALAKLNSKQAILTTHNPAILDGLNLDDDEQRLFVVSRGRSGSTKIKRIKKPVAVDGKVPPRLSELFLIGAIGGLPKGF